jgi:hypothetical protein
MSMHLVGPYLTTTSYKKRKVKITKGKQEELEQGWRNRNQQLKKINLPKETFEQYLEWVYGRGEKKSKKEKDRSTYQTPSSKACESLSKIHDNKHLDINRSNSTGMDLTCTKKPTPTYTGTKMIGIGTMHKSNMVPIFSDDEAKDISRMRR